VGQPMRPSAGNVNLLLTRRSAETCSGELRHAEFDNRCGVQGDHAWLVLDDSAGGGL
jgi:hypothetical protein